MCVLACVFVLLFVFELVYICIFSHITKLRFYDSKNIYIYIYIYIYIFEGHSKNSKISHRKKNIVKKIFVENILSLLITLEDELVFLVL